MPTLIKHRYACDKIKHRYACDKVKHRYARVKAKPGDFVSAGPMNPWPHQGEGDEKDLSRSIPTFYITEQQLHESRKQVPVGGSPHYLPLNPEGKLAKFHNTAGDHNLVVLTDPNTGKSHQIAEVLRGVDNSGKPRFQLHLLGNPFIDSDQIGGNEAFKLQNEYKDALRLLSDDSTATHTGNEAVINSAIKDSREGVIGRHFPLNFNSVDHYTYFQLLGMGGYKVDPVPDREMSREYSHKVNYKGLLHRKEENIEQTKLEAAKRGIPVVSVFSGDIGRGAYGNYRRAEHQIVLAHPDGRAVHWLYTDSGRGNPYYLNTGFGRLDDYLHSKMSSRILGGEKGYQRVLRLANSVLNAAERYKLLISKRHPFGRLGALIEDAAKRATKETRYALGSQTRTPLGDAEARSKMTDQYHDRYYFQHRKEIGHTYKPGEGYAVTGPGDKSLGKIYRSFEEAKLAHGLNESDLPVDMGNRYRDTNGGWHHNTTFETPNGLIYIHHMEPYDWLSSVLSNFRAGGLSSMYRYADWLDENGGDASELRSLLAKIPKRSAKAKGRFSRRRYARIPVGKHGTPDWNPGNPDAETIERRKTDPLWMYHRGQIDFVGNPLPNGVYDRNGVLLNSSSETEGHAVIHPMQHDSQLARATLTPHPGFVAWPEHLSSEHPSSPNNQHVGFNPKGFGPSEVLSGNPSIAWPRSSVFNPYSRMHASIYPLLDMTNYAAKGDPYRMWSASILGGNRHAIPHLVALLRNRDNPVGWWNGWTEIHRRMEQEQGNLNPGVVKERLRRIAAATENESSSPQEHKDLAESAFGKPDWLTWRVLSDHMRDNGLSQYADLIDSELENVDPVAPKPKGKRRFSRLPDQSAALFELRVIDAQILAMVRSGRPIPENLIKLAVQLRSQLLQMGQDEGVMPIPYQRESVRRYSEDETTPWLPKNKRIRPVTDAGPPTRPARAGEMEIPTSEPVKPKLSNYTETARIVTLRNPRKKASVFSVYKDGAHVGYATHFDIHEPFMAGRYNYALHSTWEGGRPTLGTGNVNMSRRTRPKRYAAVSGQAGGASIIERGPFVNTPDQRRYGDAPWNRMSQGYEAVVREAHAAKEAMRAFNIPVDDKLFGPEAFHRHVEAMANMIRTNASHPAVNDYISEAVKAGDIEPEEDNLVAPYDHKRMTRAAENLLAATLQKPSNSFLKLYRTLADKEAARRGGGKPTETISDAVSPTSHDIELPEETKSTWKPSYRPKPSPESLKPITNPVSRRKADIADRLGFMKFMSNRGVSDAEAIQEIAKQYILPIASAKKLWTNYKKSQRKLSRIFASYGK